MMNLFAYTVRNNLQARIGGRNFEEQTLDPKGEIWRTIRLLKISGEKLSTNGAAVENFILEFKPKINELGLCPDQIYNADEIGLVFKDLNNKTLVSHTEKTAPGRKNSKQRVTIMQRDVINYA